MSHGSRNHINVLSSNFIIALPGHEGTISELTLSLKYQKKAVTLFWNWNDIPRANSIDQTVHLLKAALFN
jgi:predicted Rossmann-fold nucleotide-binding protein